jgi:hypothetical protein
MRGLTGLAESVEFFCDGADFDFERFRRNRKGKGVEATGLVVARPIFQRATLCECPHHMSL